MTTLHLHGLSASNMRRINMQPFADWLGCVDRRLERRTGIRLLCNNAPRNYWEGLFHIGESWQDAADDFLEDWRK
jgi:hypothetical protein